MIFTYNSLWQNIPLQKIHFKKDITKQETFECNLKWASQLALRVVRCPGDRHDVTIVVQMKFN